MVENSGTFTDGAAYELLMGQWTRLVGVKVLRWLDPAPGLDWLDVGCGTGAFTEELIAFAKPARIEGIDPSPDQLAYARHHLPTAVFSVGDSQALPMPDNSFDAAIMALVIAFVPNPQLAINEMARVVRPGGSVTSYMWGLPDGAPVTPLRQVFAAQGFPLPLPVNAGASRPEAMLANWVGAGLTDIRQKTVHFQCEYANFDDFWTRSTLPIGPQGKVLAALTEDQRSMLYAAAQKSVPTMDDGRVAYPAYAHVITGRVPV